ncbi:hypothetical protein DPMN_178261 [Dreissena polymorpha]|uniref:Uncharacterized protein n=1 Tax=Dreissena polymorpha TaxID=45954 RepID=A0A9D4EBV0_DREPO|nr:hypothetical protein DPMN_178261 [Dreissena polymorpha]
MFIKVSICNRSNLLTSSLTSVTLCSSLTFTFIQVSICNVIRGVMEGKAFVSIIADILEDADIATIKFLVKVHI